MTTTTPTSKRRVVIMSERRVEQSRRVDKYIAQNEAELRRRFGNDTLAFRVGGDYVELIDHDPDEAALLDRTRELKKRWGEATIYTTIDDSKVIFDASEAQRQ